MNASICHPPLIVGLIGWATHSTSAAQGLDMDLPGNFDDGQASYFSPSNLASQVPSSVIDQMVTNILTPMAEWGLLDAPPPCQPENGGCDTELYEANATSTEHAALSQNVAEQGVLLLQNNHKALPLRSNVSKNWPENPPLKVAVVGSACDAPNDIDAMLAKWDLGNYYVIGGSGRVIPAQVTTVVQGLRDRAALDGNVTLVRHGHLNFYFFAFSCTKMHLILAYKLMMPSGDSNRSNETFLLICTCSTTFLPISSYPLFAALGGVTH